MRIALLGYGKMGKMVEQIAREKGIEIVEFDAADIAIDFSHASCVLGHVKRAIKHQKNLVIGTTGWGQEQSQIFDLVQKSSIGLLYSPNFSIGIQLFLQLIERAASLFDAFPEYDVAGIEEHHRNKQDAPSGTALAIMQKIKETTPSKKEIPFASVRYGNIPGTHTVVFDSLSDTITLQHSARNREAFAQGALLAAEWLLGRKGIYTFEDLFKPNLGFK